MMTLKLAWRNIWRNRRRTLITAAAIAAAIFLALAMRSMQTGMYDQLLGNIVGQFSGYVQVHGAGYWDEPNVDNSMSLTDSLEKEILEVEHVNSVIPRLETFGLTAHGDLTKGVLLQGIIPEKEKSMRDHAAFLIEGEMFKPGRGQIVVAKGIAKYFGIGAGDTIVFMGQGYHGASAAAKYEVSGILDLKNPTLNQRYAMSDIESVREMVGGDNITTALVLQVENQDKGDKIAEELKAKLDSNTYEVMNWEEMMPEIKQLIQADQAGDYIFIGILYMIISFGIFGTILMMTQERMYEFGVLLSIGMSRFKIIKVMVLESLFLAFLGILAGLAAIMPIIHYINRNPIYMGDEVAEMMEDYGFTAEMITSTSIHLPITHSMIILIITMILTIYPVLVIRKLDPIKAMKK